MVEGPQGDAIAAGTCYAISPYLNPRKCLCCATANNRSRCVQTVQFRGVGAMERCNPAGGAVTSDIASWPTSSLPVAAPTTTPELPGDLNLRETVTESAVLPLSMAPVLEVFMGAYAPPPALSLSTGPTRTALHCTAA
ncbi:hypothetical protein BIW11_03856 [Tropilaelaps mercedesae]|uniref:Uncharacterized protein n=1 Tax=Tropilaelaps mercedesae TaxID=418985 RepID=A0A1V9XES4_9ACAR|nr:hypothetical protein BIW11_03856 [Tropilaelaps mercedesae]